MAAAALHLRATRGYGITKPQQASTSPAAAVILPKAEMERIRKLLAEDGDKLAQQTQADRLQQLERSVQRRERIQTIDRERNRLGTHKTTEELEEEAKRQEDIRLAHFKLDEERDEVKVMNKVVLYSKCVTIRDAQLDEKKRIKDDKVQVERRQDLLMEMERLKALKTYEEREQKRIEDRRKGALVIRTQIEERELERLKQQQLKQKEQREMLDEIEKLKEEEREEAQRRVVAAQRLMEDVKATNAEQIRQKTKLREADLEEERRIAQYLKEKERKEQEIQQEQDRVRAEKEKETARLRAQQEKVQDKQAELDALRAKRAQEQYEREWRKKEREEALRAARINQELSEARETQKREKEALLAEQALIEYEQYQRVVAVQREEDQIGLQKREQEKLQRAKHQEELRRQMQYAEEERRRLREEKIEEGLRLKKQREEHEAKLEAIRRRKLQEMEEQGVPEKYRQELARKRTSEPLRPAK
eukprot:GGOE01019276.1.p1 GENE.GGOE01019276.1~~GGOE01019276.1.p1  ORF type:complete len:477 (+),score=225.69 GGOE01019276.1:53-1483(+)